MLVVLVVLVMIFVFRYISVGLESTVLRHKSDVGNVQ